MATTAAKADVPTFSYAQAAKGLAASTTTSPEQSAKVTDETVNTTRDAEINKDSTQDQTASATPAESSKLSEKAESLADHEAKSTTTGSTKNLVSGASSPAFGTASTSSLAKDDEIAAITNGVSDSHWEGKAPPLISGDKASDGKDKDGKKDPKAAENNVPVKELKAAPPPAVNVWQQRKEAQEAKAKASASVSQPATVTTKPAVQSKAGTTANSTSSEPVKPSNNKKKVSSDNQTEASGSSSKDRKRTENGKPREEGSKKPTNRNPRSTEEAIDVVPPPVADATAWPTPQTALGEEKRKALEKGEKPEKAEKPTSTRGKEKWTPVPYVPTAVFNTPLPTGARRGGRPSRGGREGGQGSRGGAQASSTGTIPDVKAAAVVSSNQGQSKQHANLPDRGRSDGGLTRTNSLPAQSRKPVNADASAQQPEQRRFQSNSERPRADTRPKVSEESQHAAPNGSHQASVDNPAKNYRESRSVKAPEFVPSFKAADRSPRSGSSPTDAQSNGRFIPNHERKVDNPTRTFDASRDTNGHLPRDREYKEYSRDKGDFSRDREQQKERGDIRPDRSRGGYRGRGGHSYNANHHPAHFQNSSSSNHQFVPKSFHSGDRPRPSQQAFANGTQHASHRLSLRSPSVPNTAGLYSAYPLPDINTMYQGYPPVAPGPMSAIPYQPYMEPFSLFNLIQMQLEYYFSVDNLCKDLYLRKHMDSQGFVRLSFIAGFKRIRNLTEEFEMLRHCGRQLRNAEYIVSEDGQDCLRPRDKWEQWVLPVDQRDPSAQNDGPTAVFSGSAEDINASVPMSNGVAYDSYQPTANGLPNGVHDQSTTLSSAAPEFTPHVAFSSHSETTNVGHQ